MRRIAPSLSILGGLAAILAALLAATQAVNTRMNALAIGGAILFALASIAAFPLATRIPTLAALLQLGIAFALFGFAQNMHVGIAWLPATALFTTSGILLVCPMSHQECSLFDVTRVLGTLLAGLFVVMGIDELAAGHGPTGLFLKDLLAVWPMYPLFIGPLLGWLGRRWVAIGGVLLIGEFLAFVGVALWSGDPGNVRGWGGTLLFIALWAVVGVVYVGEWWRRRPHRETPAGTGVPHVATR